MAKSKWLLMDLVLASFLQSAISSRMRFAVQQPENFCKHGGTWLDLLKNTAFQARSGIKAAAARPVKEKMRPVPLK